MLHVRFTVLPVYIKIMLHVILIEAKNLYHDERDSSVVARRRHSLTPSRCPSGE